MTSGPVVANIAFVEPRTRLEDLMVRYRLSGALDRKHFHTTLDDAVCAIPASMKAGNDRRENSHE